MKRNELTSFYLEALLLVAAFVAMILVLTGVFGTARARSASAKQLTQAVTLASDAAEAVSASESLEQAAVLLDEGGNVRLSDGVLKADYLSDGTPCLTGKGDLTLTVVTEPSAEDPLLLQSRIEVFAAGFESPVFTLETANARKGAAA